MPRLLMEGCNALQMVKVKKLEVLPAEFYNASTLQTTEHPGYLLSCGTRQIGQVLSLKVNANAIATGLIPVKFSDVQ